MVLLGEGYEMLLKELDDLVKNKRKEIANRLRDAKKSGGDLSENSEYEYAKNEQAFIEGRIEQINEILQNHVIINGENSGSHVDLGSTVVLKDMVSGKEKKYKVVSSIETDPEKNKISDESPIGSSLLHKKIGDEIIVKTPQDKKKFKIVNIV
ncbi:MAG: transcription elongation factor GreA [Actinomycetota bacterium]|nr:transcription elongation factor GreA [Actinomycetota bacterium]